MDPNNKDMPFVDHLEELRKRLTIVLVAHVVVMLLAFSQSGKILQILTDLNPMMELIFVEPSEIMRVYIEIALVVAVALCSPLTIYQIWQFISEGLYENEKHLAKLAVGMGFLFFVLGVIFSYKVIVPLSLRFFTRIAIDEVAPMISVKNYISFILSMLVAMGVVFNLPSFVYIATKLGLLTPETLKEYNKYIILLIFIASAIITPPDVVSQMMMAVPMLLLLQLSGFISKKVYYSDQKKKGISS